MFIQGCNRFRGTSEPAHYVVYLDEFGHIGPYVSRSHPRFRTSPVFGFAGFMLPAGELREFAIHFHQLKCRLLRPEIQRQSLPAWRWEKKGAQLFTERNLRRYPMLVQAATRLIDRIREAGGHVVACGGAKPPGQTSADRYQLQLLTALRRVAAYCEAREATFMVVLDQQKSGKRWRTIHVEACTRAMFGEGDRKCRSLMEPPLQAESDLFQTLQCADWICGLAGRLYAYRTAPADYPEWGCFEQCFGRQLDAAVLPGFMPGD